MLGDQVAEFNRQASSIASLNAQIVVQEAGGQTAGDLRDQRDQALKALSQLANVNVIEQPGGSVNVYIGTYRVVDGSDATTLKVSTTDPNSVLLGADPQPLRNVGGQIGATTDALTKTYPAIMGKLDAMAAGIVTAVNTLHATGWTQSGGTNVDFFDPTGTTAATIDLSSAVKSDPSQIAAGTTVNGPGDNTLALAMAQLRSQKVTIGTSNASITEFYADMVSDVGFQVANADASATVHQTLAQQAQTRLQSETGASVDEELMSIMRFQQAYQAAAKVVTVADEMTQTLLNMYTPTA
jgi:flagellar hook-associated protein 1 FlgK